MDPILIPIVGVTLGCAIPIIAIITDYFTKKAKLSVMEKAIEKGLPIEGLSLEGKKGPRAPYRSGMIALAVGVGIAIFAFIEKEMELLGIASIPCLIGIVLIINDRINYERLFNKKDDPR